MTPGKQTTEFWLTLGTATAALWLSHAEKVPGTYGIISAAVLTAIYTILRASLKNKAP